MDNQRDKREWNSFRRIKKTRKDHRCACTGQLIPAGSSCWQYVGEWEGDFQDWYCTDQAYEFIDQMPHDPDGWECDQIGQEMRERGLIA